MYAWVPVSAIATTSCNILIGSLAIIFTPLHIAHKALAGARAGVQFVRHFELTAKFRYDVVIQLRQQQILRSNRNSERARDT